MQKNQNQKINLLAYAAHPDDVEISISGTMLKHKKMGLKTGIIDLTAGELGTRGNADLRKIESAKATEILQLDARENLGLADGFFEINHDSLMKVVVTLRKYKPDIILINAEKDRHPDHGRGHELVKRAVFLSGLSKIETFDENGPQTTWRPKNMYAYIQDYFFQPDIIIDVTDHWNHRMESLLAYSSQFFDPNSEEPQTPISTPEFLENINGRSIQLGRLINTKHAEGLKVIKPIGVTNLMDLD